MPDFPIVDSHVHLYDPGRFRYSWMGVSPCTQGRTKAQFDRACGRVEVEKIVFVEVWVDERQHLRRPPTSPGSPSATPPPGHGRGRPARGRRRGHARSGEARGAQHYPQHPAPDRDRERAGLLPAPGFVEGVKLLKRFDLAFDLCVKHWQLADATKLVRQCPEVRVVLDHIGKPPIKDGGHGTMAHAYQGVVGAS